MYASEDSLGVLNLLGCYLNDLRLFNIVAYTIFQAYITYVTLKIAFNIHVAVSNKYVYTYLHGGTRFTYLKYSFNKCLEL